MVRWLATATLPLAHEMSLLSMSSGWDYVSELRPPRVLEKPSTTLYCEADEFSSHNEPCSLRSILMLSSQSCVGIPIGLLPSGFQAKTFYIFFISLMCSTCPAHLILLSLAVLITVKILIQTFLNCGQPPGGRCWSFGRASCLYEGNVYFERNMRAT
jgi:hypothetical protein